MRVFLEIEVFCWFFFFDEDIGVLRYFGFIVERVRIGEFRVKS